MRIRTIKPEFWTHEGLCNCSEFARLLAIALLNWADDEGYFMANPILIRGQVFPFEDDSTKIRRGLVELSKVGWICLGKDAEGREVGCILNFGKHQKIDRPKKSEIKDLASFDDESTNDRRMIDDESALERKGKEGNGTGKGEERNASPSPPTFETVLKFATSQPMPISVECVEGYFDEMESLQWTYKGQPCVTQSAWQARFRKWATNWIANSNAPNRAAR